MLIREFTGDSSPAGDANLVTTLQFLRNRSHNKGLTPIISTQSLINMVRNQGGSEYFTYDNLIAAQDRNSAVAELIKNIDKQQVTLQPFGDEMDAAEVDKAEAEKESSGPSKDPEKTVSAMAKRAAGARS
jgi:hypothetical protein